MIESTPPTQLYPKDTTLHSCQKFRHCVSHHIFKHKGEDKNVIKVEKPVITPINANTGVSSEFLTKNVAMPVTPIAPKFLDYKKDIARANIGITEVLAIKNTDNAIFRMSYRFDLGAANYKMLPIAARYLAFLSTDKYTAEQISKQFYDIACSYSLNVGTEVTTITISGLQENFDKAVSLVEHIFKGVKGNEAALEEMKKSVLKDRENSKTNKGQIMNGLTAYAQYGAKNPFNNVLTNEEVRNLKSDDLLYLIHNLNNYQHVITYYGPKDVTAIAADISKQHFIPKEFT
ncbi:MAG: insulinase family protein, partial [Chitinophagaceae bacterium]